MLEENKKNWMLFETMLVIGNKSLAECNSPMPSTVPAHSGSQWSKENRMKIKASLHVPSHHIKSQQATEAKQRHDINQVKTSIYARYTHKKNNKKVLMYATHPLHGALLGHNTDSTGQK